MSAPPERDGSGPRREGAIATRRSRVGGWAIAAILAGLGLIAYVIRYALIPFVLAAAVGFVTDPLIMALRARTGLPRWLVGVLLYLVLLALVAVLGYAIGLNAIDDLGRLVANIPDIVRRLIAQTVGERGFTVFGTVYSADRIMAMLVEAGRSLLGLGLFARIGASIVGLIVGLVLTLVLVPYFMISGPRLADGVIWLIPPERRQAVTAVLPRLVPVLRRYLVGIVIVVAYAAGVAWIGFGPVAGLRNSALLAITVGVLELLPVVGPIASIMLVGAVAVQQTTLSAMLFLIVFVVALRLSIDNLVGPIVLGQVARLHPVVIIAAFICGAMLFGVVGLLLAVPVCVTIRTVLEHYYAEPIAPETR